MKSVIKPIIFSVFIFIFCPSWSQVNNEKSTQERDSLPSEMHRFFQVSFVPGLSTNGLMSNKIKNDISVNILSGSVYEVSSLEVGSLLNFIHNNCSGFEVAGLGNFVGGNANGFQCAGIINTASAMKGIQSAGLINYTREANCIQIGGLINLAASGKVNQIGGLLNNFGEEAGFQIAGLVNNSQSGKLQVSGLVNRSDSTNTIQIAGLVNNSNYVNGVQIAGLVNNAKYVKGVQIGVINIADSILGIPIGVFNFIKNGYHKLEISANEMFYANIAYLSGIKQFHTIVTAGINPSELGLPLWTYGSGIGTTTTLFRRADIDIDVLFHNIVKGRFVDNNYLYKLDIGMDWHLSQKSSLYIGASYNFLVTSLSQNHYIEYYSKIAPYSVYNYTFRHNSLTEWIGFKAGLRFF
jgi:hypothetical protein